MPKTIDDLPMGAKIKFGKYSVEEECPHDIKWIKVNTYGTTFISEFVEDFRAFDASELNNDRGNTQYSISNIDSFLNSSDDEWYKPKHEYDIPPDEEAIVDHTPYTDHVGFLAYFSKSELESIIPSEIITSDNEIIERKIYLPSSGNIFYDGLNSDSRWEYFVHFQTETELTSFASKNTKMRGFNPREGLKWYWWLRDSDHSSVGCVRYVDTNGYRSSCAANRGVIGIRPALALMPDLIVSNETDEEGYFTLEVSTNKLKDVCEKDFFDVLTK